MTKTRVATGGEPDELDAAIADLRRKLESLEKLKRARDALAQQTEIQRDLMRRRRAAVEAAETEARESGALALLTEPPPSP